MTTPSLLELEKELKKVGKPSASLCIEIIKEVCERSSLRRPDLVVKCGKHLFYNHKSEAFSKLGNNVWDYYEHLLRAAIDMNNITVAQECLSSLQSQFGESIRVKRLEGLLMEAQNNFEEALQIYDDIIKDHPTDALSFKRKVAIFKSQNLIEESITALNEYLKIYQNDLEAYEELADIYLSNADYKSALFCIEEMILSNPTNYIFHLKYADILYTIGDYRNARKYYSQSLNNNSETNMRALFGLYLTCKSLGLSSNEKLNRELGTHSREKIIQMYKKSNNKEMADYMRIILEAPSE